MIITSQLTLGLATFLCSLVAGFLFAFAVVVMPGIRTLGDREFLLSFQRMDGVIQRGHPLFGLVWIGSALALVAGIALGIGHVGVLDRLLLALAGVIYLAGVMLPTFTINVPLNNELQSVDVEAGDASTWRLARERFEARWNRWNAIRTVLSALTTAMLIPVLIRFP